MLLNLVINAEQAMTITADGRGTLVVRTWHDGERDVVLLEVSDDGPGLAPEVLPRIFDPFFTTKDVGKGTGLGLTVAYAIVQEHGGAITSQSAPGEAPRSGSSCRRRRARRRETAQHRRPRSLDRTSAGRRCCWWKTKPRSRRPWSNA